MFVRQQIEDASTEDIFVPSLMILKNPAQQLFRVMVWPHAIAQFFPPCDYVYVQRDKKRLFRTTEETGLVPYQVVVETIEPLLDDYEFGGLKIKYLSPDKSPAATRLVQTLHLEPIDLSQYTQMAPDGFHDVAMPGTPG
jgi:hypothetical protein